MSRINKYDKEAIVRAIMHDVPTPDKKKRKEELQAAVVKAMSPEARKLYKSCPSALRTYHLGDVIYDGNWDSRNIIVGDVKEVVIDELTKKYMYGEAKGAEDQAMQELRLFGTTKAKKVAPELQKVMDALDIVNSDAPAEAKAAAQRIIEDSKTKRGDSSSLGQFYRALDESRNPDPKIAERGRQGLAFLRRGSGKGGGLTLSMLVHDAEIDDARNFLRNIPAKEIDFAHQSALRNARQTEIVRKHVIAQKKKFSEVGGAGQAAGAPIEEDMTDETDGEE